MSTLTFALLPGATDLYTYGDALWPTSPTPTTRLLWLAVQGGAPATVELGDSWTTYAGCYVFVPWNADLSDPEAFSAGLKAALGTSGLPNLADSRWLVWVAGTSDGSTTKIVNQDGSVSVTASVLLQRTTGLQFQVVSGSGAALLSFGQVTLSVPNMAMADTPPTSAAPVLAIAPTDTSGEFLLQISNASGIALNNGISVSFDPSDSTRMGTAQFSDTFDMGALYRLFSDDPNSFDAFPSAEIRYYIGPNATELRYPFYPPELTNSSYVPLNARLDVLTPTDPNRSRFVFAGSNPASALVYVTPNGQTVTLTPVGEGGIGLGLRPRGPSESTSPPFYLYLTPAGDYIIDADANPPVPVLLMIGLAGTEYLLAWSGDHLSFTPGGAAWAQAFTGSSGSGSGEVGTLSSTYTTAWTTLLAVTTPAAGLVTQGYCVQPVDSVYFAPGGDTYTQSTALGCKLIDLAVGKSSPPFPMVPYTSIYLVNQDQGITDPNPDTDPDTFTSFELAVLGTVRWNTLADSFDTVHGPQFFAVETIVALQGGTIRTALGLIVGLNDGTEGTMAGTIATLRIAVSPINPDQHLEFTANENKVVEPTLSNALARSDLFLVIANRPTSNQGKSPGIYGQIGTFANEIEVGEFTFIIDPSPRDDDQNSGGDILIFKFTLGASVQDLAADPSRWTEPDTFVANETDTQTEILKAISDTQNAILNAISVAQNDPTLYATFLQKVSDPNWTGVLSVGALLDYTALPDDLLVLMGGIKQPPLLAHHIGVNINQISTSSESLLNIDLSSIFAVIDYEDTYPTQKSPSQPPPTTTDFQVLKLQVLYNNSLLAYFNSKIALTVPALYADLVDLTGVPDEDLDAYNAIILSGAVQSVDGADSVSFDTNETRTFTPKAPGSGTALRVIQLNSVTDLNLVPVLVTTNEDGSKDVTGAFTFSGNLKFYTGTPLDLFSYDALPYTSYRFIMVTNVARTEFTVTQPLTENLDTFTFSTTGATTRSSSYASTLPVQLTGMTSNTAGIVPSNVTWWVHDSATDSGQLSVTVHPVYALTYRLPMGSLGALSSSGNDLEATVLVGWKPGGSSQGDESVSDVISMLFEPPDALAGSGGFWIQGVFLTWFDEVMIVPIALSSGGKVSGTVLTYSLTNAVITLLGIPLAGLAFQRDITLYANPSNPTGNLFWYLSNPFAGGSTGDPKSLSAAFKFTPAVTVALGLDINVNVNSFKQLPDAMTAIQKLPADAEDLINALNHGWNIGATPDANAGMLLGFELYLTSLSIQVLFDDPSFYGALVKVGPPSKPKGGGSKSGSGASTSGGGGGSQAGSGGGSGSGAGGGQPPPPLSAPAALVGQLDPGGLATPAADSGGGSGSGSGGGGGGGNSVLNTLAGLQIAVLYAKISDTLGLFAVDFTLPNKFRVIRAGVVTVKLPALGVNIYTDGSFRIALGWPVTGGGALQVFVKVPDPPIPLKFRGGFYFGRLIGKDFPGSLSLFGIIYEVGIGGSGGLGGRGDWGVLVWDWEAQLLVQFQGFFGSNNGEITESFQEYFWIAVTVGVFVQFFAAIDLKIISAELTMLATLSVTVAVETDHATHLVIGTTFQLELTVKLLFFKVSFSVSFKLTILDTHWGSGDIAQVDGPTPNASKYTTTTPAPALATPALAPPAPDSFVEGFFTQRPEPELVHRVKIDRGVALRSGRPRTKGDMQSGLGAPAATGLTPISLHYYLQSTAVTSDGVHFSPNILAALAVSVTTGDFFNLVSGVTNWLVAAATANPPSSIPYTPYQSTPNAVTIQLMNALGYVAQGSFDPQIATCLGDLFEFTITNAPASGSDTVAIFPMIPGLTLDSGLAFPGQGASDAYVASLGSSFGASKSGSLGSPAAASIDPRASRVRQRAALRRDLRSRRRTRGELLRAGNALATPAAAGATTPFGTLLFDSYFEMFAKQMINDLLGIVDPSVRTDSTPTTLEDALAAYETGMAGSDSVASVSTLASNVSRLMQYGLRLPVPVDGNMPVDGSLEGAYLLAGLQAPIADPSKDLTVTMSLASGATAPINVTLSSGGTSTGALAFTLPSSQLLNNITLNKPPWTATATDPLLAQPLTATLTTPSNWSQTTASGVDTWHMRALPSALLNSLPDTSYYQVIAGPSPLQAAPVFAISMSIQLIPDEQGFVASVYQLVGTDEATRDLLTQLLNDSSANSATLALLIGTAAGQFSSDDTQAGNIRLVRTNLSTDSVPPQGFAGPAAATEVTCASSATLSDVVAFLQLVWECSIVHTAGYNLALPGLTESDFSSGSVSLELLVQFGAASNVIELRPWMNSLLVTAAQDSSNQNNTIIIQQVTDATGATAVNGYGPAYAAGNAGFEIVWSSPPAFDTSDPQAYLDALYQMVQSRVNSIEGTSFAGTSWSRPVGASGDENTALNFSQTMDVSGMLESGGNRYAAVGKTADVEIALLDIFGNALPESANPKLALAVVYNDPLLTLASWPDMSSSYTVQAASAGKALLVLAMDFDAESVTAVDPDESAEQRAARLNDMLSQYLTISEQTDDPNVAVSVVTSLAAAPITTDSAGTSLTTILNGYATALAAFVNAVLNGESPTPPTISPISMNLDTSYPASLTDNLFQITVSVALHRAGVVESVASRMPSAQDVESGVSPYTTATTDMPTLTDFATDFETAYASYNGANSQLKVAAQSDVASGNTVWAVRFGTGGMQVALSNTLTSFAPTPLSTMLLSRDASIRQYVTTPWTGTAKDVVGDQDQRFTAIDLDAWGAQVLSSVEAMFAPTASMRLASISPSLYDSLVSTREDLVDAMSGAAALGRGDEVSARYRVDSIYTDGPAGVLSEAVETLRQALLSTLTAFYGTSTIAQVVASVSMTGEVEPDVDADHPPQLFGKISNLSEESQTSSPPFTFSAGRLDLVTTQRSFTFLVATKDPQDDPKLNLDLRFDVGFLQHQLRTDEERCDYIPSSWLTFTLPDDPKWLQLTMGDMEVPIPIRSFPPSPVLVAQSAAATPSGSGSGSGDDSDPTAAIQAAMLWTYNMSLVRPTAGQDDLVVSVTFNQPVSSDDDSSLGIPAAASEDDDPPRKPAADLFEAMARFVTEMPQIAPNLSSTDDAVALRAFTRALGLVTDLANTWGSWINPALPASQLSTPAAAGGPAIVTWTYRVLFDGDTATVSVETAGAPFPQLNGSAGTASGGDRVYQGVGAGPFTMSWPGLFAMSYQGALGSALVERNADLGDGDVNEAFIYRTPTVAFNSPILPLLENTATITVKEPTSLQAITTVLSAVSTSPTGEQVDTLRFLMQSSYSYALVTRSNGQVLRSRNPVFLVQQATESSADLGTFESNYADDLATWRERNLPTLSNGEVDLTLTVFANISQQQLPLVVFQDIALVVDPSAGAAWFVRGGS